LSDTYFDVNHLLTQERAAALLGVAPRTLENYRARRIGPPIITISRRCVRYRLADLEAWIASKAIAGEGVR
jgi:Helix-turn-helix domain